MPALCFGLVTDTVKTVLTCLRVSCHCHQAKKVCCFLSLEIFFQGGQQHMSFKLNWARRFNTEKHLCFPLFFSVLQASSLSHSSGFPFAAFKGAIKCEVWESKQQIHTKTCTHCSAHRDTTSKSQKQVDKNTHAGSQTRRQ